MSQRPMENASSPVDVAVVGGVNVDVGGTPYASLIPGDSNPGRITVNAGGVGRNIAQNLCQLGLSVRLYSAWGTDAHGDLAAAACRKAGMDISRVLCLPDVPTSAYLYINDKRGEMVSAVADMAAADQITPDYLRPFLPDLCRARAVVVDANLPEETLRFLADGCEAPLFCDPVSVTKARKLSAFLGRLHTLKPNRLEAELLGGGPIRGAGAALRAGEALLRTGLKQVFISLGGEGVCAVSREGQALLPCLPGRMVSTTGCGDAFTAALVWAFLERLPLEETALAGLAAAAIAMESPETISPALDSASLRARMAAA